MSLQNSSRFEGRGIPVARPSTPRRRPFRPAAAGAFTLIELLVVIAIISLLVSILLPSLVRAKELAQDITCMSNQRNLNLTMCLYNDEYGGLPLADEIEANGVTTNCNWCKVLGLSLADRLFTTEEDWASVDWLGCPRSDAPRTGMTRIQIGMNVYMRPDYNGWYHGIRKAIPMERIGRAGEVFLHADKNLIGGNVWQPVICNYTSSYYPAPRHANDTAIVGFADGHIGAVDDVDDYTSTYRYVFWGSYTN